MAAGLGFKTFVSGDVLSAGDVNGYLMQGVLVFASAAARDAAITSPQEGQFAYTKDTNGLWYYDGAAWVASGATGDIEGVTAGIGISGGGTSGTVTVTNSMATAIDAKGDLVAGTGSDAFSRLAVGANNTVLTADSAEATGMKWAAPAGAGANWSAVNSGGTSLLGGVTSVTISGITSADKLMVYFYNVSSVNASSIISIQFSGDTGSNYHYYGQKLNVPAAYATTYQAQLLDNSRSSIRVAQPGNSHFGLASGYLMLSGGNAAGEKMYQGSGGIDVDTGAVGFGNNFGGRWNNSATVSSVTILSSTGNFDNGDIFVYKSA